MPLQEIPRCEWLTFCRDFSRQYQGQSVSLEVFSADLGATMPCLRFEDITADFQEGSEDIIAIVVGQAFVLRLIHIIIAPLFIKLEQSEAGGHEALEIQSSTGATTTIRLRTTVPSGVADQVILD